MTTISVASHKGGSGKTTAVANVAGYLAHDDRLVLVVDSDPQGALGAALGVPADKPTLYEVLAGSAGAGEAIRRVPAVPGLSVLPADLDLAGAELEVPRRSGSPPWQLALRDAIAPVVDGYELVFIDTAPGLGVLPYLALTAADAALVVCPPDVLSYRALAGVLSTINQARQVTPDLRLLGIAPTLVASRTRHEADVVTELAARYGDLLLPATPRRVAVQDAALAGEPIHSYAPGTEAAVAFAVLAEEVIRRARTEAPQPP